MLACKWCKLSVSLNTVCLSEDLIMFPSDCLSDNVMMERSRGACSWDWTLLSTHNKSHKTPPFLQSLALNCSSAQHYPDALLMEVIANWKTTARLLLLSFDSWLVLEKLFCTSEPNAQQSQLMQTTDAVITASLAPVPRLLPARLEYLHWVANKMCTSQASTALYPP